MKCPECDGTGKVVHPMMSMNGDEYTGEWEQHDCEACNGTGEVDHTERSSKMLNNEFKKSAIEKVTAMSANEYKEAFKAIGSLQTNEEWFCRLSTKEKAKEMCVIMADMAEANDGVWDEEMIEAWLKEKHK